MSEPTALLRSLGRAALAATSTADVAARTWEEWGRARTVEECRAELRALAATGPEQAARLSEVVAGELAGEYGPEAVRTLADYLSAVPAALARSFPPPAPPPSPTGGEDLLPFLPPSYPYSAPERTPSSTRSRGQPGASPPAGPLLGSLRRIRRGGPASWKRKTWLFLALVFVPPVLLGIGFSARAWVTSRPRELGRMDLEGIYLRALAFSGDGRLLAACGHMSARHNLHSQGEIRVWDPYAGRQTSAISQGNSCMDLLVGEDGRSLTVVCFQLRDEKDGDLEVQKWDPGQDSPSVLFKISTQLPNKARISPDGKKLVAVVASPPHGTSSIKVWDLSAAEKLYEIAGRAGALSDVSFSPDGLRLVYTFYDPDTEESNLLVWDLVGRRELLALKEPRGSFVSPCFSADGLKLAYGYNSGSFHEGEVRVYDFPAALVTASFRHDRMIRSVCISPDGKRVACGGSLRLENFGDRPRAEVKVWDLDGKKPELTLHGHADYVGVLCFSPDGNRLASASWDETVRVWDVRDGLRLLPP